MNLRQLGYFLKIGELQSFTRAANVLHVAQPSLSRQIQLLEQDLGVLLLVRSDKGAKLTEAGHALRERAQAVLHQVRQIRDDVGEHSSAPKGELRFGVPPVEAVTAVIVVKQGQSLTEREVTNFCSQRLGGFKVPKGVVFVEALPKNPSGKLLKRELRQQLREHFGA